MASSPGPQSPLTVRDLLETKKESLQLERMRRSYIYVARLGDLSRDQGYYFIDYHMRPALAFRTTEGLPHLISAKCTHLGCTVAKDVDAEGRILCPCHVSYFDLRSGAPQAGSPAKEPLPTLAWVLREPGGGLVAGRVAVVERASSHGLVDMTDGRRWQPHAALQFETVE